MPVITTGPQTIAFSGGTSVPGGNLTTGDRRLRERCPFTDADLTDTHTVSTKLTNARFRRFRRYLTKPRSTAWRPARWRRSRQALIRIDCERQHGHRERNVNWKLADLPVYLADFIPKGETLTLTYTVTVTDSQGATSTQDVTVTIAGTDTPAVVWIATTPRARRPEGCGAIASNWETGTVPTATDDAIIITDQLHGLTPSYPVTIDAPAVAKTRDA